MKETYLVAFQKKLISKENFIFLFFFLFILANWLLMIFDEKLACNDFYSYMLVSDMIFAGKFNAYLISPPLIPFLFGIFGRFLNLFVSIDGYILAGRLITLFSGFGVVLFTYKFLKIFSELLALFGTIFLIVSPFFLKLISTAQTDMLFLFFVSGFFYSLYIDNKKFFYFLGALLTRYEGVLFILLYLIDIVKKKSKNLKYLIIIFLVSLISFLVFSRFYSRLYFHIKRMFANKIFFYYIQHPQEISNLLYNNLLFFIPSSFPIFIKWVLLVILIIFFIIGLIKLYRTKKVFFFSVLLYICFFLTAKGSYIGVIDPEVDFRRFLSFIWLFYIISLIGLYYLYKNINIKIRKLYVSMGVAFFSIILYSYYSIKIDYSILPIILLLPIIFIWLKDKISNKKTVILASVFMFLCVSLFYKISIGSAYSYINNDTSAGSYVFSKWVKKNNRHKNTIVYTYPYMLKYYTKNLKTIDGPTYNTKLYENKELFIKRYFDDIKKKGIRFIYFNGHVLSKEVQKKGILKILFEERDKGKYFKVYKHLKYRGRYAGSIVIPIYDTIDLKGNL